MPPWSRPTSRTPAAASSARAGEQLIVRAVSRVRTAAEISALPVKFAGAVHPLTIGDLADVGIGTNVRTGAATENGEEALIGTALMVAGENSRTVAHRVGAKLAAIQAQLPAGFVLRPQYNRADLVDATVGTVEKNLFEGAVLVVAVLFVLLGNWRAALIVTAAIPLAFLFAITGMARFGISGQPDEPRRDRLRPHHRRGRWLSSKTSCAGSAHSSANSAACSRARNVTPPCSRPAGRLAVRCSSAC
ncbi:MAG: efflux RND transporter permease subunit [Lacunisphaera sp.]